MSNTLAFFSLSCPSMPTSGMMRWRLYRRISWFERLAAGFAPVCGCVVAAIAFLYSFKFQFDLQEQAANRDSSRRLLRPVPGPETTPVDAPPAMDGIMLIVSPSFVGVFSFAR